MSSSAGGTTPAAPDPRLRGAAAHVFVAGLDEGDLVLTPDDEHHLVRVLRLRSGEVVTASDGAGRWRPCRWTGNGLSADGEVVEAAPPRPAITIAFSVAKGDRSDWAVEKLTELGVDRLIPLVTERSVVRLEGSRSARQIERWRRLSRAAAMQSRLTRLAVVEDVSSPAEVLDRFGADACAAEPGGEAPGLDHPVVLIGPEGGWHPGELPADLARVGVGPSILRSETAAVVLGAALCLARALSPG